MSFGGVLQMYNFFSVGQISSGPHGCAVILNERHREPPAFQFSIKSYF